MKPAAIITLVLAGITFLWSVADLVSTHNNREQKLSRLSFLHTSISELQDLDRLEDQERQDGLAAVFALMIVISSAGLIAHAKTQKQILEEVQILQAAAKRQAASTNS